LGSDGCVGLRGWGMVGECVDMYLRVLEIYKGDLFGSDD
jgi:hypothetical protein